MNYFLEERFYINDKNFYKSKNIRHIGTTETDKKHPTTYSEKNLRNILATNTFSIIFQF